MIDAEEKAKVVRKLTQALHQAPDQPHNFANVPQQVIGSSGLHITDLAITIGDTTSILAKQLQAARRNAPPTYENLVDLASKKLNLGRHPERALAEVLGVPLRSVAEQKQSGRVPRGWFEKIHDLPDLDETRAYLDSETKRVVHILGQQGYSPEDIHNVFQRIRMTRAGVKQLASALHGTDGDVDANAVSRMREGLFGDRPNAEGRLKIWLATHARLEEADTVDPSLGLSPRHSERVRIRYVREIELRRDDPAYRRVAEAAELIARPFRAKSRREKVDLLAEARELRLRLHRLFGDHLEDRLTVRFAQLTGLDDRHALDLLKGANGVGDVWWRFLEAVEHAGGPVPVEIDADDPPLFAWGSEVSHRAKTQTRHPTGTSSTDRAAVRRANSVSAQARIDTPVSEPKPSL